MLDPTFKQRGRDPKNPTQFDMIVQAQRATLHFDTEHSNARVYLDGAEVQRIGPQDDVVIVNDKYLDIPIPNDNRLLLEKRIQERTTSEMVEEQAKFRWLMAQERKRQAMAAALWIGSGRINRVSWDQVQRSFIDYGTWDMQMRRSSRPRSSSGSRCPAAASSSSCWGRRSASCSPAATSSARSSPASCRSSSCTTR